MIFAYLALSATLTRQQAPQWPDQLNDPNWKPRISYMLESTAIAGQVVVGPKLHWNDYGVPQWTLLNAPQGMKINASGKIQWVSPVAGRYLIRVQAKLNGETEEAGWLLNVLSTNFPDPVIYSTRHIDYVVPQWYAEWMDRTGAARVVDAYYEFGRDLLGWLPGSARQSILYDPNEGGAHSGIPIVAGNVPFGDNDANHWRLGYLFHELGHNLNDAIRVEYLEQSDHQLDVWLHGMVEFDKIAWVVRMLAAPEKQKTNDLDNFKQWMQAESQEFVDGYKNYIKELPNGAQFATWDKSPSVVWAGFVHEYAFTYGSEAVEKVLRCIRRDGIALGDYPQRNSSIDRITILLCIMSNASGHDLRGLYKEIHFPIDEKLYDSFDPIVAKVIQHLPAIAKNGAVECPVDHHYYCVTPYGMSWAEAETTARHLGGHLATIRSKAQEQWLANKYGRDGWLWVGFRRNNADQSWSWVTRETTDQPIWEPERPESDPNRTCGVLILHEDPDKPVNGWFGLANRPPDEGLIGIMEFDHAPTQDTDSL